ncbi:MAG: 4Fe-4S binding protein [bacterium]|nr:4Fe-4S binding protein [bacterium]
MKEKNWKEIPIGGLILDAGNATEYKTGDWRTFRPEWSVDKCIHCFQCWANCPDSSILIKDDKMTGIDYDHCKGCGICAKICPKNAIEMVKEVK